MLVYSMSICAQNCYCLFKTWHHDQKWDQGVASVLLKSRSCPSRALLAFAFSLLLLLGELRQRRWRVAYVFFCSRNSSNSRNCISQSKSVSEWNLQHLSVVWSQSLSRSRPLCVGRESLFSSLSPSEKGPNTISTNTGGVPWMAGGSEGWWQWPQTHWQFLSASRTAL